MQNQRQRLIERLRALLAALENNDLPLEQIDLPQWLYPSEFRIHRQLSDVEAEVRALRQEIRERSQAPVRCAYTEDQGVYMELLTGLDGNTARDKKYIMKKSHGNE